MKVIACTFNDVDDLENWRPDDPFDFEEWISITVGDDKGGSNFQLHVCTPVSISGLSSKIHVFMIDKWDGTTDLIGQLDAHISAVENDSTANIYHELSKHWMWEYGGM